MALLRSIWVVFVSLFDLNFGSGDKWWAWAVVYASFVGVVAIIQDPVGAPLSGFLLLLAPLVGISALGVAARRRWRTPTQVHLTHD